MQLMAWSPFFETHLETVDAQHHALVDMVNTAAPHLALNDEAARRALGHILDQLFHYAAVHFRDEERLMVEKGLATDYVAHHHRSHNAFVEEVTQMRQQYEQNGSLTGAELLRFLGGWLTFHILVEDQQIAKQIKSMAQGLSAQQAYSQLSQAQDSAHEVYTSSLLDLFTLLTQRNRKLVLANEEVQRGKAALEDANKSLEARVQARTRDLANSLADLKRAQVQLLQSEKMAAVGQLAAGVAHEINNPVGFVNSNLATLSAYTGQLFELLDACESTQTLLPPQQRAEIEAIRRTMDVAYLREDIPNLLKESSEGLARVTRIVGDLRDFAQSDDGQWGQADLNRVLESSLHMLENETGQEVRVVKELSPLPRIVCVVSQISQVIVNVLINARQAIAGPGTITVRSQVQGDKVLLEINDTGCGMTDEVKTRIFEPFFTTRPVGKGTGLGMATSWEIIQRHHGRIDVQSCVGAGSTFFIQLPLQQPAP